MDNSERELIEFTKDSVRQIDGGNHAHHTP
jgi:hypothetical protein